MLRIVLASSLLLASAVPAFATWSVIALDARSGQVIVASATCVRQAGFPQRQPNAARDLMDVQAVIVPGLGVAACQAGVDGDLQEHVVVAEVLAAGEVRREQRLLELGLATLAQGQVQQSVRVHGPHVRGVRVVELEPHRGGHAVGPLHQLAGTGHVGAELPGQ